MRLSVAEHKIKRGKPLFILLLHLCGAAISPYRFYRFGARGQRVVGLAYADDALAGVAQLIAIAAELVTVDDEVAFGGVLAHGVESGERGGLRGYAFGSKHELTVARIKHGMR